MSAESEFDAAMRNRYAVEIPAATRYRPMRMIEMIDEYGAIEAVRRLMAQYESYASEGYRRLWECQRLDLSFEALMQEPRFASLFSADELAWARRRLQEYGYPPPDGFIETAAKS